MAQVRAAVAALHPPACRPSWAAHPRSPPQTPPPASGSPYSSTYTYDVPAGFNGLEWEMSLEVKFNSMNTNYPQIITNKAFALGGAPPRHA